MFVCTDQIMNGTVTMETVTALIDKPTFKEAVQYFKEKCVDKIGVIFEDTEDRFSYSVRQEPSAMFDVVGSISKEPLKIL